MSSFFSPHSYLIVEQNVYLCPTMHYVDVILPVPLPGTFTYALPSDLQEEMREGMRVLVPFGRKKSVVGIAIRLHDSRPEGYDIKEVLQVIDKQPVILMEQYRLWQWIADYYMSSLGEVYKAALPSGMKIEEGYHPRMEQCVRLKKEWRSERALHIAMDLLARADKQLAVLNSYVALAAQTDEKGDICSFLTVTRDELLNDSHANVNIINAMVKRGLFENYPIPVSRLNDGIEGDGMKTLTALSPAQQTAYDAILSSFAEKNVTLLHGVTSSGKTEIYIHLIRRAIEQHQQVLYLLPEIALTVQMMQRLRRVFGSRLGIYHSKYSDAERVEIWQKQLSDAPYDIILGARAAVLLPFQRLGLVIVDEEHETSYKQQDPAPRYHARSAAIMLAHYFGAKTLLGTATPSMESYYNATKGKYGLVNLTTRYRDLRLPQVTVVDIKDLRHRKMMHGPFSPLLLATVRQALERGEQAILFQNRRGFSPVMMCKECGWVPRCECCDVSLTLHRNVNQLTCHYCGFVYKVPAECPACGSKHLFTKGFGTEKIEDEVCALFPEAKVARMDLDTTRSRNAYERIINDFSAQRTQILIGTQMVTKGLDFAHVSVVGILNADAMLNIPDFRAYEHAFMMMSQVSGRAGRAGRQGQVILQTMDPHSVVVRQVVNNDFLGLYKDVMMERQAFHYPPITHLIYVYLRHQRDEVVNTAAIEMASRLRSGLAHRVLGPDKPSVAKVKALHIRKIVIKLEQGLDLRKVKAWMAKERLCLLADKRYSSLSLFFDVDPV